MKQKGTNPIGKNTVNLTANVPRELYELIARLAGDKPVSEYVRDILTVAAGRGIRTERIIAYAVDAATRELIGLPKEINLTAPAPLTDKEVASELLASKSDAISRQIPVTGAPNARKRRRVQAAVASPKPLP